MRTSSLHSPADGVPSSKSAVAARLIVGDCREILPTLEGIDAVITDPVWPNAPSGMFPDVPDPSTMFAEAMAALPSSVQRIVIVLRCDSDPRFLVGVPRRFAFFQTIVLPYALPSFRGRVLGGDEIAYWFGEPIASRQGRRVVPGRAPTAQPRDRPPNGHPCSRALIHFRWLVEWASDAGETVCDPFMGSGTTGVACVEYDRPFVGVERQQRYADLAAARIEDAQRQGRLQLHVRP